MGLSVSVTTAGLDPGLTVLQTRMLMAGLTSPWIASKRSARRITVLANLTQARKTRIRTVSETTVMMMLTVTASAIMLTTVPFMLTLTKVTKMETVLVMFVTTV